MGVICTFALSRYARRQQIISQHSEEICQLATEWYEQIHEMEVALEHGSDDFENVTSKTYFYVHNRLVLPKYLRSLHVLKNHKQNSKLMRNAEEFLSLVTNYQPALLTEENEAGLTCALALGASRDGKVDRKKTHKRIKTLLPKLDNCLQKMNREAGSSTL